MLDLIQMFGGAVGGAVKSAKQKLAGKALNCMSFFRGGVTGFKPLNIQFYKLQILRSLLRNYQ